MDKNNRRSSIYDEDTDWLDEDDDYLDDGGLLGSLLFGEKKKKNKKIDNKIKSETEKTERRRSGEEPRRRAESPARADSVSRPERRHTGEESRTRRRTESADRADAAARPERKRAGEEPRTRRRAESAAGADAAARPERRRTGEEVRRRTESAGSMNAAAAADRPARRRRPSSDRTPVKYEYDEYYHDNSSVRRAPARADRRPQKEAATAGNSSVDAILQEVINIENDSMRRQEQRREAWERTQRNVAKAKAEVERLELEREANAREEARRRRVQREMERRRAEEEALAAKHAEEQIAEDTAEEEEASSGEKNGVPAAGQNTVPEAVSDENNDGASEAELYGEEIDETAADSEFDTAADDVTEDSDESARNEDALDMDELERMERDIDEDKLKYSESDTEDLGLGEIGRMLGFDAVELENVDEEPEDDSETDSEKFFRENLLDEADPKVVNPEKKRVRISNKIWGVAFVVLLALFIIICVIYVKNYARMKYNEMDINEISEDQLLMNEGVASSVEGYRTIALYGVDSRDANADAGTNSDCIIIASINESTKEIKLVSVYRDTLMEIASGSKDTQKVNYAYQLGGAVTAINTLNINLDLNVTDYVAVDFSAMAGIIDAVGGVEVTVTDDEVNNFNKNLAEQISLSGNYSQGITEGGTYTLDGQQAVAYSRIRSTDKGDITRTERQRVVLVKIIDKLLAADAGSLKAFVDVSFSCISTSLNKDDVYELAEDAGSYTLESTAGFPFAYSAVELSGKGSCLAAADMASNVAALHNYLYGDKDYKVSGTAQEISNTLSDETGVSAQKVEVSTEATGNGISGSEKTGGDFQTITEPPAGMTDAE